MLLRRASEFTRAPVEWLWPERLAFGKPALFDGDPERGKSLVATDLCARLSTGRPWPDGSPSPGPAGSVYVCTEDGAEDTLVPRLLAAGGDPARVSLWTRGGGTERFGLPSGTDLLEQALARTGARLVVIDPLADFLDPNVIVASDVAVRRALDPLAGLAERRRVAVLLIRHLTKQDGGRALYRGLNSIGFSGLCRTVWLAGPDPADPAGRVLAQVKTNIGAPQPSLAYAIDAREGQPVVRWCGPCRWTADDLTGNQARGRERLRAKQFLLEFLADGPRLTRDILRAARPLGLSQPTLNRAREELEIRTHYVGWRSERKSYWLLPDQQPPAPGNDEAPPVVTKPEEVEKPYPCPVPPVGEEE